MGAMDLYRKLKSGNIDQERLSDILSGDIVKDIKRGCLHVFMMPPGNSVFGFGEKLYLIEHAEFYIEKGDGFDVHRGIIYLSSARVLLHSGDGDISVPYSDVIWITIHDDMPQILEIQKSDGSLIARVPDAGLVDMCIRMIRDRDYTKEIDEPISYESLIERADYAARTFAFEHTLGEGLPDGVRNNLGEIAGKLGRLREALKKYPEYAEDTVRFIDQLVPAAIHVIMAYRVHKNSGSDDVKKKELSGRSSGVEADDTNEREMNRLNDRVFDATKALNDALQGKLAEICKGAADRMLSQADALKSEIELESLRQGEIRLVF